jgi:hypothetical protein
MINLMELANFRDGIINIQEILKLEENKAKAMK